MASDEENEQGQLLNSEQRIDAGQALGCGVSVPQVAAHFGLTETELRIELGMPQWCSELPPQDRQRTLFDEQGAA